MNQCIVCNADDVNLVLVENKTIQICRHCGAIFLQDYDMIIQMPMPLQYDNNIYAVSYGMAILGKQILEDGLPLTS